MMFKKLTVVFLVTAVFLLCSLTYSRAYFLLQASNHHIRSFAQVVIDVLSWDSQNLDGWAPVDYLLHYYSFQNGDGNDDVAVTLLSEACALASASDFVGDPSISVINAILDNNISILSFWLYRGVSLVEIKHYVGGKNYTVQSALRVIQDRSYYIDMYNLISAYNAGDNWQVSVDDICLVRE